MKTFIGLTDEVVYMSIVGRRRNKWQLVAVMELRKGRVGGLCIV